MTDNIITIEGKKYQVLPRYAPAPFRNFLDLSQGASATFELHIPGGYGGFGIAIPFMVVALPEDEKAKPI